MNKLLAALRGRRYEIFRALLIASLFFFIAEFVTDTRWRILSFVAAALFLLLARAFAPRGLQKSFEELKSSMDNMAEGNLQILNFPDVAGNGIVHDFSVSLLLLNSRLRQIVDKVKNAADNVGGTSEQIVELSRLLLKSGRDQSESAESASQSIGEINQAIIRIAGGAESLNDLGVTASSAAVQLTAGIEEVTQNASQLSSFAKETKSSMQDLVRGMREIDEASDILVAACLDTDVSMQNMHERIQEVTQLAVESDHLSEQASSTAEMGGHVMAGVEQGMHKIASAFDSLNSVVGNLSQRSEQIGQILTVITQIADQTNLLSLNAAILSAQAGPHGKGFGVVAEEIRNLSTRTAASVHEIEQLISSVRIEIGQAVELTGTGKRALDEGWERSGKASRALHEILSATSAAREKVGAIPESSRLQIQAENEVQSAIQKMKEGLEEISATITRQTRVSQDVYSKAERMMEYLHNVEHGMKDQTHAAKEVSGIVQNLANIIRSIHHATAEQSVRSSELLSSVDRLKTAMLTSTAGIRTLNTSSLSLDQESFILKQELARFGVPEPARGGTLRLGVTDRVSNLDPVYARFAYVVDWVYNFYEGLVEFGEGTDIRPCLADRWEISEDGLVYLFHLKRNVKFHNGKEVTAIDVKDSFERVLRPGSHTPGTWVFDLVAGAEEYASGAAPEVSGISIQEKYTLKIRLNQPIPFFIGMLAQCYAFVVPSELCRRTGPLIDVIGTGPFRMERFVPDHELEMARFQDYHGAPLPYLNEVQVQFGLSELEVGEGMRSGRFHYAVELQKQQMDTFLSEPEWRPRLKTNVQLYTALLAFNCRIAPLDDVRVRQAISMAIDRKGIVRDIIGIERAIVANGLLPPGLPGYDPAHAGPMYDPDHARALLRQAGWKEDNPIEFWQTEAGSNQALLERIAENLQAVGVRVSLKYITAEALQNAVEQGSVPARITKWVADYPDPDNFLYVPFHSRNPAMNLGFHNEEFDRVVEEARYFADIRERILLYRKAQRIWLKESPCAVLFHNRALVLHQQGVHGCIPHFTQPVVRLKKVWLSNA